jgi:hypothetical protein
MIMAQRNSLLWAVALPAVFVLCFEATTRGQNNVAGNTALENARAGSVRGRAPGNIVTAGVARAQNAANFARGGVEITETSRPVHWRVDFLVEAINIVFEQVNQAIALFANLLAVRAGGEPVIAADFLQNLPQDVAPTLDDVDLNALEEGSQPPRQPPSGRK